MKQTIQKGNNRKPVIWAQKRRRGYAQDDKSQNTEVQDEEQGIEEHWWLHRSSVSANCGRPIYLFLVFSIVLLSVITWESIKLHFISLPVNKDNRYCYWSLGSRICLNLPRLFVSGEVVTCQSKGYHCWLLTARSDLWSSSKCALTHCLNVTVFSFITHRCVTEEIVFLSIFTINILGKYVGL